MLKRHLWLEILLIVMLLGLAVLSALYFYPYASQVPHRDSGIYLYIGSEILEGKTIYKEVWEHKPPFIFYINAPGLLLGGGTAWGVWGLEIAFLFLTLVVGYLTLRKRICKISAFLIVTAAYLAVYVYMSGNFTEEYALLFQALILFLFLRDQHLPKKQSVWFLLGILTGIVFNIKQTYIDLSTAIIIFTLLTMILSKQCKQFKHLVVMGSGFLLTNLLVVLTMAVQGALKDWWQTAYLFNFAYSSLTIFERLEALQNLFQTLEKNPFFVVTAALWLAGIVSLLVGNLKAILQFLFSRTGRLFLLLAALLFLGLLILAQFISTNPALGVIEKTVLSLALLFFLLYLLAMSGIILRLAPQYFGIKSTEAGPEISKITWLVLPKPYLLGLINLPIVLFLVIASWRNYNYYFITFYPSILQLFFGAALFLKERIKTKGWQSLVLAIALVLFAICAVAPLQRMLKGLQGPYDYNPYRELVEYVQLNSTQEDTLLVWAMDSGINYLAERSAPSRYSYVDPAYYESSLRDGVQETLYEDLSSNPPLFILDMHNPDYPLIEGMTAEECLSTHPLDGSYLNQTIRFICQNYEFVKRIAGADVLQLID